MGEQVHERKIFSVCLFQRPLNNKVLLASKGLRRAMIYPITLGEKSRFQNLRKVISCTHVAKPTGIRGRTCDYYYTTRNRTKWNTIRSVIKWLSKSKRESDLNMLTNRELEDAMSCYQVAITITISQKAKGFVYTVRLQLSRLVSAKNSRLRTKHVWGSCHCYDYW